MAIDVKKVAELTSTIYNPAGEFKSPAHFDISEISDLAVYLKKNRVLFHVLKERETAIQESGDASLLAALKEGNNYLSRLATSLSALGKTVGSNGYQTFKTYYGYHRLTTDLDIIVPSISVVADKLKDLGWHLGEIMQGTMDVEMEDGLPIGLHEKVGWETPPIFDDQLLWRNLRQATLNGYKVQIPSPEVDLMAILAHIPFEKLYLEWGEMCYLYATARSADLFLVLEQARRYHWRRSLEHLLVVLNSAHRAAFNSPSPFEKAFPHWSEKPFELPYECSMIYAGTSLVEIGAWKKISGVVFDVNRFSHFFRGRISRRNIRV